MKLGNLIKVFAFSLLLLGLPAIASAQWRDNRGYGNNGYNNGALKSAIKRVKSQSKELERRFDRNNNSGGRYGGIFGRNGGGGGYGGGDLENLTDQFENAAKDLENEFGSGRNMSNSYDEANRLVSIGQQIDRQLGGGGGRGNYNMNSEWGSIRNDLQFIANAYGIRYGGWGNGNGNGNGNGGGGGRGRGGNRGNYPYPY